MMIRRRPNCGGDKRPARDNKKLVVGRKAEKVDNPRVLTIIPVITMLI